MKALAAILTCYAAGYAILAALDALFRALGVG